MKIGHPFLFITAIFATSLPSLVVSDSVEISDWDVSEFTYFDDDTNETEAEAYIYAGEAVTWEYNATAKNIIEFDNEEAYDLCLIENSTVVDASGSYTIEAWPLEDPLKGPHYYANGVGDACTTGGEKIKLVFKKKAFEGSSRNSCEGMENATSTVFTTGTYPAKSAESCVKTCQKTQDCFGIEWRLEWGQSKVGGRDRRLGSNNNKKPGNGGGKFTSSCTLFDDYPSATGPKDDRKVVCLSVRFNNTVDDDEDSEDDGEDSDE